MKRLVAVGAMGVLVMASQVMAAANDAVKAAAEKLAEKGNYSWKSTPKSDGGSRRFSSGPTEGKIKDGVAQIKMTAGEQAIEALVKGETVVIKIEGEWKTAEELRSQGNRNRRNPASFMARRLRGFKAPAEEVLRLVEAAGELTREEGAFNGEFTEAGAKKLLLGDRQRDNPPEVKDAGGSVKFWIEEGTLTKYEVVLRGKMTFREREFEINRSATVELKDVGSTELEIPEGAKEKLGG